MACENDFNFRILFENMLNAFAYHEVLFDKKNKPIDYIFIDVNDSFEIFTGLKRANIIGKKVTEVIPDIRDAIPDLISIYGKVALTGKSNKFELYFEPFNKWYLVSAYSPAKRYFATVFDDITSQKQLEEELREKIKKLEKIYQKAIERELQMKELKDEIKKLKSELLEYKK